MLSALPLRLALLCLLLVGCLAPSSTSVFVRPGLDQRGSMRYALAPIQMPATAGRNHRVSTRNQEAADSLDTALRSAFLRAGMEVVSAGRGNQPGEVDAVIEARITEFSEFNKPGITKRAYRLGYLLEATDRATGETLWSILGFESDSGDFTAIEAAEVAEFAVAELRVWGL